jgi:hypothetical protein
MAKMKVVLTKPGPGVGLAYFAGDTVELEELQAKELIALGVAALPDVDEDEVNTLPEDLPARDLLFKAGIKTKEDLKSIEDFSALEGIGKKTAEKIENYLIEEGIIE